MVAQGEKRCVHVVAIEAGSDRAAELSRALRVAGHPVCLHVLPPDGGGGDPDERLRRELALVEQAVAAAAADRGRLLLADERASLAVPEALRALLDGKGLPWDEAWARVRAAVVSRFGSPKSEPGRPFWRSAWLAGERPRLLELLYEVNRRQLEAVEARWPGDGERRRRLSLFREGAEQRLRPGLLGVLGARRVDVATPWDGPAAETLADLALLKGREMHARPTPVHAAWWLAEGNPGLAALLAESLGPGWPSDREAFARLETLAFDAAFRDGFRRARRQAREQLGSWLRERGVAVDPEGMVDVRVGALVPHERPLLNVLGIVREHLRVASGGWTPPVPRTVVLARVAEAAGPSTEPLLALAQAVAAAVNADPRARASLRVVVLPECDDTTLQRLAAAADLSNQPGTAGSGAAGARALGLAVNGAVTLGTRDGTVRELAEAVGEENLFLFGLGALETRAWRDGRVYRPQDVYALDPLVRLALDALVSPRYAPAAGAFDWTRQQLLDPQDPWLVVADLGAYIHRQDEALAEFADPRAFTEKAILGLARSRRFWIDGLEIE